MMGFYMINNTWLVLTGPQSRARKVQQLYTERPALQVKGIVPKDNKNDEWRKGDALHRYILVHGKDTPKTSTP